MHLQRKSCHHVILGMIIVYHSSLSPVTQVTGKCPAKMKNISRYEHCIAQQDGARDLDCFGTITKYQKSSYSIKDWQCVWTPANNTLKNNYTLIIVEQKSKTRVYSEYNLSGTSQKINVCLSNNVYMSAHVINKSEPRKCMQAYFSGLPRNFVRCGPPHDVSFRLHPTRLEVTMKLGKEIKAIKNYTIKYKAMGGAMWKINPLLEISSDKVTVTATVENLNTSLGYEVRVGCVNNSDCPKCPWSHMYTLPKRLSSKPVDHEPKYINTGHGWRLLLLTLEYPDRDAVTGYSVRVCKTSGDGPNVWMNTKHPEMRLNLSHSGYYVNITASDGVSTSPARNHIVPPHDNMPGLPAGSLNVTFINDTSFNISWKHHVVDGECYSVEWGMSGERQASYRSFYVEDSYKVVSVKEPFESYKRYKITLYLRTRRTDNESCNLKAINNSESTYGIKQVYFKEGSPISAPTISTLVTQNSMLLKWSPIPEGDIRGFLLGYMIYYNYTDQGGTKTQRNMTTPPVSKSQELRDLNSGTVYIVQISAFTRAGEGVRSAEKYVQTPHPDNTVQRVVALSWLVVVLAATAVLICVIKRYGCPDIIKAIFWPNMPNPHKSNAIQKIHGPCELQLLEPFNPDNMEEENSNNSLQVVEKRAENAPLPSCLLHDTEDQGFIDSHLDSVSLSPGGSSVDRFHNHLPSTGGSSGELSPDVTALRSPFDAQTDAQRSTRFPFPSDYTTMELFQHAVPPPGFGKVNPGAMELHTHFGVHTPGLDYVRQFSTSPTADHEEADLYIQ